jgi:hypothetical protein
MDLKTIQEVITEQSAKCSDIGRKIGFGLTAITWAFFFSDNKFSSNFLLLTALILEILYFLVDFTQYYFMVIKYKKLYTNSWLVYQNKDESVTEEILKDAIISTQSDINKNGFRFFFVKFPFLFLSFVLLLLYILSEIK